MPHGNKKTYMMQKCTGTIPKVKQRNNNNASSAGVDRRSNLVSNNLGNELKVAEANRGNRNRNQNRNLHVYHIMDVQENGIINGIFSSNGTVASNDTNTISRRNSSGLSKCDNVTKYPDKKQIETKLSQIQEYLQVATAMKTNMKKTDEQVQSISIQSLERNDEPLDDEQLDLIIKDLTDSANKLQTILADIEGNEKSKQFSDVSEHTDSEAIRQNKNDLQRKVDVATRDLQMLKEQENYLLQLQLNAEKQLREARFAQAKLAKSARNTNSEAEWFNDSDSLSISGASSGRNIDFRDLEDRIKSFNIDDAKGPNAEQFQGQIDHLQNHIQQMREGNDNRAQLIQILDSRDAQLQAQHNSLQGKLQELQNKKHQVDQLVVQLQTMSHNEESEEDDMGCHVKKIVNMKEQLTKLKDMLNLVQDTEDSIGGYAQNAEIEENVNRLIAKTDNLMQQNRIARVENIEGGSSRNYPSSNERRVKEKQVNKQSMTANEKERIKLQAELRAKKSELEELMCKHKAANSNLNHDINSEKNSELGACGNTNFDNTTNAWYPIDSNLFNTRIDQEASSESDDCPEEDPHEFSVNSSGELNTATVQPMPVFNYPTTNYIRKQSQEAPSPRVDLPHEYTPHTACSPARAVRSVTPIFTGESASNRSQIQKQLELIKTVCDSMLESNAEANEQTVPVRVRNNLTPSPIYSEPRRSSPRQNIRPASSTNALNVVNYPEQPQQLTPNCSPNDTAAYNNWLTTNSLQTQAFILNTLNQCCQMLWHQQKELSTLRNTVNVMQDRFGNIYHDETTPMCMQSNPCLYQQNLPANYLPNNYRQPMKTNQMAGQHPNVNSGSMPNLNGHCAHVASNNTTNMEHAFCNNMMPNNSPSAPVHQHQNVIGEHQLNTNHIHANPNLPAPIWNGQALNNQVAPGNRANNYWDNFRSYSRQNLFSTKSNDGTQNLFNERSNQSSERHRSGNQEVVSTSSSAGVISSMIGKTNSNLNEAMGSASMSAENSPRRISVPKRRVVNTSSLSERPTSMERQSKAANNEGAFSLPRIDSAFSIHTDDGASNRNTRKDWSMGETISQKSKLFEDLRENVYKEVASLISANEDRPHFLIQLFQDLQLVSSDPLRRNVLQSVQALITSSLTNSTNTGNSSRQHQNDIEQSRQTENYSSEVAGANYELLPHDQSVTTSEGNMSDMTADAQNDRQRSPIMWPVMAKHGMGLFNEPNSQEFHESISSYISLHQDDAGYMDMQIGEEEIMRLQILEQNGDLAEADQSCAAEEDDEGAVGGLLNLLERSTSSNAGQIHMGEELNLETEDEGEQGLDQVPIRLNNPSSIGCSPKSH